MKICIVCPRLCHGGAERVAVSLANGFVGRGHEVSFFTDLFEEQTYVLESKVNIQSLVAVSAPKYKKWWSAIWILRKYIKKNRPDVLIGIMSVCSIVAYLSSFGLGIPVIATDHDAYEKPYPVKVSLFERFYKFYFCRLFKQVTVLAKADIICLNKRGKNVLVMPNPLAIDPIETIQVRKNIVLAAGRVDNWFCKGFDVLIRAWARVVSGSESLVSSGGWKLVIAGVWRNPETRTYLDGIAKECGVLDKIEYTGFVEDMPKLYAESSIFVLSSRYEGFGLVLIEAMSQGCACIACDYKGRQREIISPTQGEGVALVSSSKFQGSNSKPEKRSQELETRNSKVEACENGILCETDNVEALAEGIQKMITDDEYREGVRANAIERSKYYSIENTMDRWEDLFSQIVKN